MRLLQRRKHYIYTLLLALALLSLSGCFGSVLNGNSGEEVDNQDLGTAASSDGGGGGGSENDSGSSGGDFSIDLPAGLDIAKLKLKKPDSSATSFILRATLPLIPGVFPSNNLENAIETPFATKDGEGNSIPLQTEIVSRFANPAAGADVVEVMAEVPNSMAADAEGMVEYGVFIGKATYPKPPAGASARELLQQPNNLPGSIRGLLDSGAALNIVAADHQDRIHLLDLFAGTGSTKAERFGPVKSTALTYGTMEPTTASGSGDYDHLVGVHAAISTMSDQEVIFLDLMLNNGPVGKNLPGGLTMLADHGSDIKPNGYTYFKALGIEVPLGWRLVQWAPHPFWQDYCDASFSLPCPTNTDLHFLFREINSSDSQFFTVDTANELHLFGPRAMRLERLALVPDNPAAIARAKELLDEEGLAFVQPGTNSEGDRYFSWWNPLTARYFPQNQLLPNIDFIGAQGIRNKLSSDFNALKQVRESGSIDTALDVHNKSMGTAHPLGGMGGGTTGGKNIHMLEGTGTAQSAWSDGINWLKLQFFMHTDRQPQALFLANGDPFDPKEFQYIQAASGAIFQTYYNFWNGPWDQNWPSPAIPASGYSTGPKDDPFGYVAALLGQTGHPTYKSIGQQAPGYQVKMIGHDSCYGCGALYYPTDDAHFVRYSRLYLPLAWLANDSLAKLIIGLDGALRIGTYNYTPYTTSTLDNQGVSMMPALRRVSQLMQFSNPAVELASIQQGGTITAAPGNHTNQGFGHGRGHAWMLQVAAAAYRLATPEWRSDNKQWFEVYSELLDKGRSVCSGYINSGTINKSFDGIDLSKMWNTQAFEEAFVHLATTALWQSFWEFKDPAKEAAAANVVAEATRGMLTSGWDPFKNSIYYILGFSDNKQYDNFHYFEVYGGTGSVPAACQGSYVPAAAQPPVHSSITENEETGSVAAFGLRANPAKVNFYLDRAAQLYGVYNPALSTIDQAKALVDHFKNSSNFTASKVDGFAFNTQAAMLAAAQVLAGEL